MVQRPPRTMRHPPDQTKGDGGQGVAERIPGFMESVRAGLPDLKHQGNIGLIDYVICNTFIFKENKNKF